MADSAKKILIFSLDYYPGDVGGAEVAIGEITNRIDPADIEFHMVSMRYDSNEPKQQQIGNVLIHQVGLFTKPNPSMDERGGWPLKFNKMYFQIAAGIKGMMLHRQHKYDGIWVMMAHGAGVPAAIFKLFYPSVPYVLSLQEGDPPEHIEKVMRPLWPLFKRAFTKADVVQPLSHFLAEWAKHMGYKGPIEVIPNGASPQSFAQHRDQAKIAEYKEKLGKKEGEVFLVSVGRLVEKNATDDVIRALVLLPENIKYLVVGDGPDRQRLEQLTQELKLNDRVQFVGQVDRSETAIYRGVSDIFLRPSRSEGFGISFVSTMAARLPLIATQEGGIADFLFDPKYNPDKEQTGWVVQKDSPEEIAQSVKDIIAHPELVEEVVERAYNLAYTKYNWDFIAKDMRKKVFGRVLK